MILTYSMDRFPDLIKAGVKIHSIRKPGRWRGGMTIHHWMHSPRHPWKSPYCFLQNKCTGIQPICISIGTGEVILIETGEILDVNLLSVNDGLGSAKGFWQWFDDRKQTGDIIMDIVHWTDYRYGVSA